MSNEQINIFILDDDLNFVEQFKSKIKNHPDLNSNIDLNFSYNRSEDTSEFDYNYDLYFINHNMKNESIFSKILNKINYAHNGSKIFILSNKKNLLLLEKLCGVGVQSIIDKTHDIDYSEIVESINNIFYLKDSIMSLQSKISDIDRLRSRSQTISPVVKNIFKNIKTA